MAEAPLLDERSELLEIAVITVPDVEENEEVRVGVAEDGVDGVGLLGLVRRALARVARAQGRGQHGHLGQAVLGAGLDEHARDARVELHPGHRPPRLRQLPAGIRKMVLCPRFTDGAELGQSVVAVVDGLGRGPVDERELERVAEPQVGHAQDDLGQVRSQDLGLGELVARLVLDLAVEAHAQPFPDPAAAALALVGRGPRDRRDGQAVDARPRLVLGDPGDARVHDIADAGDGQRRLGDVRGHDDLGQGHGVDETLLAGRQARKERQDLDGGPLPPLEHPAGLEDVLLGRHEDQDVARRLLAPQVLDRLDGLIDVVLVLGFLPVGQAILDLDRVEAPADLDDRRVAEGLGELLRVERRRGDDELEVGPLVEEPAHDAEKEVDVERALVGLVDDDRVVLVEAVVALRLGEEDAVGHDLDVAVARGPVLEADLVADRPAERLAHLFGDAGGDGHGREAARLGDADAPGDAPPRLEAHLRDLGALAAARLARDDDDAAARRAQGGDDLVGARRDRQLGRVGNARHVAGAGRQPGLEAGAGAGARRSGTGSLFHAAYFTRVLGLMLTADRQEYR